MKNVYVSHAKNDFDFRNELYIPIRQSALNTAYNIVLPHEFSDLPFSSKEYFQTKCNILVVEGSYSKMGVGIEVGWADAFGVPTVAVHKKGFKLPGSLEPMCKEKAEYSSMEEMIKKLFVILKKF